jgi:hypothetical protein
MQAARAASPAFAFQARTESPDDAGPGDPLGIASTVSAAPSVDATITINVVWINDRFISHSFPSRHPLR